MSLDEAKLAQLLVREHDKLAAYAWSLVRDDHLVDDLLQELALIAIRKRDEILDEEHFLAWMRVTCRLTALDMLKRRNRRPHPLGEAVLDLLDSEWQQHDVHASADTIGALRECLKQLSPYARNLVELRYGQGLKSGRIAEVVQRRINTVYVALARVHQTLAACIEDRLATERAANE